MYPANSIDTLVNPVITTNTVYANASNTSFISLPLVGFTTGLSDVTGDKVVLDLFPNPTSARLEVRTKVKGDYQVAVYNLLGATILEVQNQNMIDVSALEKGIYFVRLYTGKDFYSARFVRN